MDAADVWCARRAYSTRVIVDARFGNIEEGRMLLTSAMEVA